MAWQVAIENFPPQPRCDFRGTDISHNVLPLSISDRPKLYRIDVKHNEFVYFGIK